MSPAKHSVAAEQKWHQKNVGALGLLHDGRSLQKHHRAWGSPGESKLCDVGVSAGSGRAWSSLDMMGTSVQCDRRFSRCEKPLFGQGSAYTKSLSRLPRSRSRSHGSGSGPAGRSLRSIGCSSMADVRWRHPGAVPISVAAAAISVTARIGRLAGWDKSELDSRARRLPLT
eukprot:scaffold19235_cov126-Isochrysis_galbana.AAC.29